MRLIIHHKKYRNSSSFCPLTILIKVLCLIICFLRMRKLSDINTETFIDILNEQKPYFHILLLYKGFRPIEKSTYLAKWKSVDISTFSYIIQVKFSIHLIKFPIEYRAILQSWKSLFVSIFGLLFTELLIYVTKKT